MNHNIRKLKVLFEAGEIDKPRWEICFAGIPETRIPTCKDCQDYKRGDCKGEEDPIDCFLYGSHSRQDGILLHKHNTQ